MKADQTIQLEPAQIPMSHLASLWGRGVGIAVQTGSSLETLLCDQLGIATEYLKDRIQTVIVNGRAVDEPADLIIHQDDVIALSTAMPGLVGTTLRKGGHLASMRAEISQENSTATQPSPGMGIVTLKLFNLVAREIGPQIIARGIWLSGQDAVELVEKITAPPKPEIFAESTDWVEIKSILPA